MLKRMNKYGRIAACGTTSNHNKDADLTGLKNFYVGLAISSRIMFLRLSDRRKQEVIMVRLKIFGFINIDWLDHQEEVTRILVDEWKAGNLLIRDDNETVVDTKFEDIPKTWAMLFTGGNTGKLITRLV